jgi:hypothetical protein
LRGAIQLFPSRDRISLLLLADVLGDAAMHQPTQHPADEQRSHKYER